jgi:hypothetical protein
MVGHAESYLVTPSTYATFKNEFIKAIFESNPKHQF